MESKNKTNVFNEEGRILQVEYAIKNVSKAGTIIGVVCTDGVLLLGIKKGLVSYGKEKIYRVGPNSFAAVSGLFSDCLRIIGHARKTSENFLENNGVTCSVNTLARKVGEVKQGFTQRGGMRPFGVAVLYAGDGLLLSTDPSGTVLRWNAKCYGENDDAINREFKKVFTEKFGLEESTKKIFDVLIEIRELNAEESNVFEIFYHKGEETCFVNDSKILDYIKEAKLKKESISSDFSKLKA